MSVRPHYLDVTSVIDRNEIAASHGPVLAWQAAIKTLTAREAKARSRRDKMMLRLELLNAQTQLELAMQGA